MSRALLRLAALPLCACALLAACQTAPTSPVSGTAPMTESTERVRIQGEAMYFEKILLPADAQLRVQVIDNLLSDTPQAVLADQVTTVGPGPYEFSIDVPRAKLRDNGQYGLHASVSMPDGSLRFVTDTRVPVNIAADTVDVHVGRIRLTHVQP